MIGRLVKFVAVAAITTLFIAITYGVFLLCKEDYHRSLFCGDSVKMSKLMKEDYHLAQKLEGRYVDWELRFVNTPGDGKIIAETLGQPIPVIFELEGSDLDAVMINSMSKPNIRIQGSIDHVTPNGIILRYTSLSGISASAEQGTVEEPTNDEQSDH